MIVTTLFTKATRWPTLVQQIQLIKGIVGAAAEKAEESEKKSKLYCLLGRIFYAGSTALVFTIIRFYFVPFIIIFFPIAALFHYFQYPIGKSNYKFKIPALDGAYFQGS